ncbi:hypothetical protein F5J12DRAFT_820655 [Pisolithus orientalis]|uniref:uncharacterized protein n=1 Tax=Pisolithus orientalis TaxID=936130 RepID=UPI002224F790|nr:uncharacterized protein F5J12DRAFT_820655 [Pisolithus orientalis]KAI6012779.1 hypothetical protein F5J12DRAFT_820655 [Pisolithus orientalis]
MMVGTHFDAHVMGACTSLFAFPPDVGTDVGLHTDQAGDKILGPTQARALAGMLHKIGLLPRCNHQQVQFAYEMYSRDDREGWRQSRAFKKAFSIDVNVEFVGVWDTVNCIGIVPRRLPFTRSNNKIRYFRHALSLDEQRARFIPSFWNQTIETNNDTQAVRQGETPHTCEKKSYALHITHHEESGLDVHHRGFSQSTTPTDAQEVWFAGCHRDVGGGAVKNGARHSLSRISLRWMIRECFKARTGILFQRSMFQQIGMDPETLYPHVLERPPALTNTPTASPVSCKLEGDSSNRDTEDTDFSSEEQEDLADALSPIHDRLKMTPIWWILEGLPQQLCYQRDKDNAWVTKISVNRGRGRRVPRQSAGVQVHRTVRIRMEAEGFPEKYQPKAEVEVEPTWVD